MDTILHLFAAYWTAKLVIWVVLGIAIMVMSLFVDRDKAREEIAKLRRER